MGDAEVAVVVDGPRALPHQLTEENDGGVGLADPEMGLGSGICPIRCIFMGLALIPALSGGSARPPAGGWYERHRHP